MTAKCFITYPRLVTKCFGTYSLGRSQKFFCMLPQSCQLRDNKGFSILENFPYWSPVLAKSLRRISKKSTNEEMSIMCNFDCRNVTHLKRALQYRSLLQSNEVVCWSGNSKSCTVVQSISHSCIQFCKITLCYLVLFFCWSLKFILLHLCVPACISCSLNRAFTHELIAKI